MCFALLLILIFKKLKYSWITMLCYFHLYRKVIQWYVYICFIYKHILFEILFPYRLLQNIDYSSLFPVGSCWLSILIYVVVAKSCPTLCHLWTVAHQAPLSMEFPRQEYWSGLPFPSQPRDLICTSSVSCIGRRILYHCVTWEAT